MRPSRTNTQKRNRSDAVTNSVKILKMVHIKRKKKKKNPLQGFPSGSKHWKLVISVISCLLLVPAYPEVSYLPGNHSSHHAAQEKTLDVAHTEVTDLEIR